ncbi:methyltransferase domain-containing protein [Rufibacter latericius]|uniref:Methyltransferase domain-containing protein n=1 Tax=Rufibacter latericius TaxID=2487040 RepID=A0A3M9MKB6_9BACT|nr:methyltransferase domain-containing protein [Rufibacter latericius]RNI25984.1 methyltransferase domain-containing protein [Rufibacter latericius]
MFSQRSTETELMDDLTLASDDLRRNLQELEFINVWLGGHEVVRNGLNQLLKSPLFTFFPDKKLKIADLGSGGGDTLRMVAQWARQNQLAVELVGIDANAFMLEYSASLSQAYPEITYRQFDVFSPEFAQERFDVVICSLFLHHFQDDALAGLLAQLSRQVRVAVLINDIHRHPLAYHSIKGLTKIFSRSYLVKNDAPLSVLRAFSKADWQRILERARVTTYQLRWRWAFRWQIIFGPVSEKGHQKGFNL